MKLVKSLVLALGGALLSVACTTTDDVVVSDATFDGGAPSETSVVSDTGLANEAAVVTETSVVVETGAESSVVAEAAVEVGGDAGATGSCNIAACNACGAGKCAVEKLSCKTDAGAALLTDAGTVTDLCDVFVNCLGSETVERYNTCTSAKYWLAGSPPKSVEDFATCLVGDGDTVVGKCSVECAGCVE